MRTAHHSNMTTKHVNRMPGRKPANLPSRMAARTHDVRPVGAWVQPEPVYNSHYQEAVVAAHVEEARMKRELSEKAERLQHFQAAVRQRVQALARLERQRQLQKSFKAVEVERNVVRQTALAAERSTPRKNWCSLRTDTDLSIGQTAPLTTQGGVVTEEDAPTFQDQVEQIQQYSAQARQRLTTRQVVTDQYVADDLPGGVWKEGATRDHPAARNTTHPQVMDLEDDDQALTNVETEAIRPQQDTKMVHFDPDVDTADDRHSRIARRTANEMTGCQVERVLSVPHVYPGVQTMEDQQQAIKQRAMYRRLFMDIEREQVKENIRRKEHRKKINQLKWAKEQERQRVESEALQFVAPRDPVTGETEEETTRRQEEEETSLRRTFEETERQRQKNKETERYLEALKHNLVEKIEKRKVELPALCCCGETVWDTDPQTCANNCIFYRNPKAYARALQSLLVSCDVL